jgi:hypothetical protein
MAVVSIGLAPAPPSSCTATDDAQSELSCKHPASDSSAQMVCGDTAAGVAWQALQAQKQPAKMCQPTQGVQ